MGENAAETLKEIEETRERLGNRLDELEERVPAATLARRSLRTLAGGGIGIAAGWFLLRRLRRRRVPAPAPVMTPPPVHVSLHLVPERWVRSLESDRVRIAAGAFAAGWLLVRLIEARRS